MTEDHETRRKRLYMRSIRRGIKEMDLILAAYADRHLRGLSGADLDLYERLLAESDHDLYQWVTGQSVAPEIYDQLMAVIIKEADGLIQS